MSNSALGIIEAAVIATGPCARVTMLSDWRIGAGRANGTCGASSIIRDADNMPFVSAKSLTGAWRDACGQLAAALDSECTAGAWTAWVDTLFGARGTDPSTNEQRNGTRAAVRIGPARLPPSLRKAMLGESVEARRLRQALTIVRSSTHASPREGSAVDANVRHEEFARGGAILEAAIDLPHWDEPHRMAAIAILAASALLIESIGARRRRGASACTVELLNTGMSGAEAVSWLRDNATPPPPPNIAPDWDTRKPVAPVKPAPKAVEKPKRVRSSAFGSRLALELPPATSSQQNSAMIEPPMVDAANAESSAIVVSESSATDIGAALESLSDEAWIAINLEVMPLSPMCIHDRLVGNMQHTLDFVPGSHLLPHVTRVMVDLIGLEQAAVRASIAKGDIQVMPATVMIGGRPGRPVPLGLPAADEGRREVTATPHGGEAVVGPLSNIVESQFCPGDYIAATASDDGTIPPRVTVVKSIHSHLGPDGPHLLEAIHPMDESGAPVTFGTSIHMRAGIMRECVRRLGQARDQGTGGGGAGRGGDFLLRFAAPDYRIGRSRKDDYGRAAIAARAWRVLQSPSDLIDSDGRFVVWFLSDTILRNERGQFATTIGEVVEWFRRAGVEVETWQSGDGADDASLLVRRVDMWHAGWGLPRPTQVCIGAGSVIRLRLTHSLTDARRQAAATILSGFVTGGMGERRGEGHGQICINDPLVTRPLKTCRTDAGPSRRPTARRVLVRPGDAAHSYAKIIERDVWREEMRRAAMRVMSWAGARRDILGFMYSEHGPAPHVRQLGTLRYALARQLRSLEQTSDKMLTQRLRDQCTEASQWLASHAGHVRRRQAWREVKERLLWLLDPEQFDESSPRVWQELESDGGCRFGALMLTSDEEWRLRHELWAEAVRTLIDAGVQAHARGSQ